MSSENQNVVRLEQSSSKKNDDFAGLKSSLGFLDWALQVQTLIQASGLPIGDGLMSKETQIPLGSMASNFGHKTLGQFITSSNDELGIAWNWEKWTSFATAFRHKSFYDIHLSDPFEIIAQYDDIKKILGRDPINSAEFHSAKEQSFNNQKIEMHRRHEEEKQSLNSQIMSLKSTESTLRTELQSAQNEIENQKSSNNFLSQDRESLSAQLKLVKEELLTLQMNHESAKKEMDLKIEEARSKGRTESLDQFQKEKDFLAQEYEKEKQSLVHGYVAQVESAKERAKSAEESLLHAKNTMVSQETHVAVINELNLEKQKVQSLLMTAHDAETKWLELSGQSDENSTRLNTLQQIVDRQKALIESLKDSSLDGKSSFGEIQALEEKVAKLDSFARTFKDKALTWKGKHDAQLKQVSLLNDQVKEMKDQIKTLKSKNKTNPMKPILLGFLFGAVGCSVIFFSM